MFFPFGLLVKAVEGAVLAKKNTPDPNGDAVAPLEGALQAGYGMIAKGAVVDRAGSRPRHSRGLQEPGHHGRR